MIEQQTIGGRAATVSYLTRDFEPAGRDDFDFAKVVFDDGDVVFLVRESDPQPPQDDSLIIDVAQHELDNKLPNWLSPGQRIDMAPIRARAYAKHRKLHMEALDRQIIIDVAAYDQNWLKPEPKPPVDRAAIRARVSAKHRARYVAEHVIERKRVSAATLMAHRQIYEGIKARAAAAIPRKELPVAEQLDVWQRAMKLLDASEIPIRDAIEREMAGRTGIAADMRPKLTLRIVQQLLEHIRSLREKAIKDAFRLVRGKLGNRPILDVSIAVWASYFTKLDYQAIALGIQAALTDGLDNTEMARKIVGSALLNGTDGVTEQTRFKIAHLARAAIKESNYRKRGLDAEGAAVTPTKGLDPAT